MLQSVIEYSPRWTWTWLGHEGNMFLFSFRSPFYHLLNPLTSGESLIFVWAKLEAQVSWPWGWLFFFRTIIALEQVFCTIIQGFCCDFFFISLQKMFESFPVPYSNVDMSQGLSNVFNQVKIFTLSKYFLVRLVSYPTRWSLYSSLDFCVDHLSWQWRPHIAGCKMFLTSFSMLITRW